MEYVANGRLISAIAVQPGRGLKAVSLVLLVALSWGWNSAHAQINLEAAVDLALRHSPRVKMAEDDLDKAEAALSETKDAYVPKVSGSSGLGVSSGITLNVPTVFTISAQSLVFSASQRDYLRAARCGVQSSRLALEDTRSQIEEDTAFTYLSLEAAGRRQVVMADQYRAALTLQSVMEQRFHAGLETAVELANAHRTEVEIRLNRLHLDDEVASLRDHLARLTGIPAEQIVIASTGASSNMPNLSSLRSSSSLLPETPKILSAKAEARSKLQRALGDSRGLLVPEVSFDAQYGRISPFNNVSNYYNLNGDYNTLAVGIQIQIPFLDVSRKAKAREAMAEALHTEHEVEALRDQEAENRLKLQHSLAELSAKAELAKIDHELAQDRLNAIIVEENATGSNGAIPAATPKDEQMAWIQERRKYLEMLSTNLDLIKARLDTLRQTGELGKWIRSCCASN